MGLLFPLISGIVRTLVIFQTLLLLFYPLITHTLLSDTGKAFGLVLTECDVWTAGARYLLSPSEKRVGGAADVPLILTECVLYVIATGMT